jgi:hypothetical protein
MNQPSLIDIVTHTPLWVWPLLAYTLYTGWRMTRDRTIARWRVFILPAIAVTFAVVNLVTGGNTLAELAGFAVGTGLGAFVGLLVARRPARLLEDGRLALAGDWLPVILLIGIFSVKYAQGVTLAIDRALATNTLFLFASAAAPAMFAAVLVVRSLRGLPSGMFRRNAGQSSEVKYRAQS